MEKEGTGNPCPPSGGPIVSIEDLLVGRSRAILALIDLIRRAAASEAMILILGESGVGKELVARLIHLLSRRWNEAFIAFHCRAVADGLLESEFCGHVKGAFTDAVADREGFVEVAERGTLFLDEVGELSLLFQVKLLRLLENREYTRLGSTELRRSGARFVAATNANLEELLAAGRLRGDFYHRLNVATIRVPPLRERLEDVPLLAERFFREIAARDKKEQPSSFLPETLDVLARHAWPGNVRELRNLCDHLAVFCPRLAIRPEDLPGPLTRGAAPKPVEARSRRPGPPGRSYEEVAAAYQAVRGDIPRMAEILGVGRQHGYKLVKKYAIGRSA